jgi:glycosyltransferase involved in cell wall biosynthesis
MGIKIAVIGTRGVPANYGGVEKFCEELYSGLVQKGYEVIVYSRKSNSNLEEYKGIKIKGIHIPEFKGLDTLAHSFVATMYATFSDADIIHFHAQGPAFFSWIPRLFAPKKLVAFTCHGIDWQRDKWSLPAKSIIKLGEIASSRFPHLKTAVSQYLIDHYRQTYNVNVEKTFTGINIKPILPLEKAKEKYNLEKEGYFIFVGRLVPEKAIETLIQSFKTLKTDKKLVIVGDASNPDDYVSYLQTLNADDERIIFTSYIDNETLSELYSNAIAYVSASKLEGLPATLLEAMSFSRPVVISDIGPHVEALEYNNEAGELFKVNDLTACAKTLENILKISKSELDKMGSSAQNIVSENFLWQKIIDQTDEIYKRYASIYLNYIDSTPKKNLKVAIVNKFFYAKGGAETVAFEEARMLEQAGHEVGFFSMRHSLNPPGYKYDKYFVDYMEFSNVGKEYSLWQKFKLAKKFIYNQQAATNFQNFIDDFHPDIIHCHGIAHQLTPAILKVAKKNKIPVVQTLHDYQIICPNYTLLRSGKVLCDDLKCSKGDYTSCIKYKCVKNSFSASVLSAIEMNCNYINNKYTKLVDKFITPSRFLKNTIIKAGIPEDMIVHVPNFINFEEFEPDYSNNGYFLFVGRLSYEKGLFTLLNAFKLVPDAKLIVAGTGPLENDLHEFKKINNLTNIEFVGHQSREELKALIKKSVALILPSEWYENCPMSIIEAFACGKPAIGSYIGGIPEMIKDDFTGYTFKYGNTDELSQNIEKFVKNSELSSVLGHNARRFVLENYSLDMHIKQITELYANISNIGSNIAKEYISGI